MEKEKMIKTARVLDKVFKILQVIIRICAIFVAVLLCLFTVIYFLYPDAVRFNQVDIGPLTFELTERIGPSSGWLLLYVWIMIGAAEALIAVTHYAIRVIRNILEPMTLGNPFHPTVGKQIRKLAFASLAIGIIEYFFDVVETISALHFFHLADLFPSSQIQSVTANFSFDLSTLVVFFVLLLLSHIFRYGEELQKLSDETL